MLPVHKILSLLFYIVALVVILQSCQCSRQLSPKTISQSHPLYYSLYISQRFDANEVKIIEDAAKEWETKTDGLVEYSIYYNWDDKYSDMPRRHTIAIIKVSQWDEFTRKYLDSYKDGKWMRVLGMYDPNHPRPTIYLVVDRALGHSFLRATIEHELGHSLKMSHNMNINSIMFPSTELGADHITNSDLEEFCKIYHCNIKELVR